jgi:ribosomal protein S27AE
MSKKENELKKQAMELQVKWVSEDPKTREKIVQEFPSKKTVKQRKWVKQKYPPCPRCGNDEFLEYDEHHGGTVTGKEWGNYYMWCSVCGYFDFWEWFID